MICLDFFLKIFVFPELWYGIVVEQLKIVACRYKSTLKGAEASWIQLGVRFEWAQIIIRNLEISKHASLNSLELTNKKTNKQTNTQIIWSYFGLSKDAQHFANLNSSWNMGEVNVDCPAMMMTMIIVWWRVMQMKRGTVVGRSETIIRAGRGIGLGGGREGLRLRIIPNYLAKIARAAN